MLATVDDLLNTAVGAAQEQLDAAHGDELGDPVWREDPVSLAEFVTSKAHLDMPPLYARQQGAMDALLGPDPKMIFEPPTAAELRPLTWRRFTKSTNVARAAWTDEHGLVVTFRDGSVYAYPGAPKDELGALVKAPSKGRYASKILQNRYEATRLQVPPDELRQRTAQRAAREYQLGVLLWGKGSGKDYLCSVVIAYLLHVLLCLRDPQAYLNLAPGENIDILNVAYNADQAKRVFFEKFKQRLYRWKWLRDTFDVFEAGRRKWKETAGRRDDLRLDINDGEVLCPRGIRCLSRHAENESYEGLNVIAWVMDEASAFLSKAKKENATKIYQTLRTSAASRFLRRWVGFIISYPRHADDFTMQKCAEAHANPTAGIYADGPATTWDINELIGRGEWVEVRPGHKVPVELANDFILDFEEALAKYCCLPPKAKDALIKQPEKLWSAVVKGQRPLIEWDAIETVRDVVDGEGNEVRRRFSGVKITRVGKLPRGTQLFMHGDPAEVNDAFGLGVAHGVPATIMAHVAASEVLTLEQISAANVGELQRAAAEGREPRLIEAETRVPWERDVVRTVIDALIVWRPDPSRGVNVDLLNVKETLLGLIDSLKKAGGRIKGGSFDRWESAETVQALQARKLPFENEVWTNQLQHRIYRGLRSAFYNDLVTLPDTPSVTSINAREPGAIYELERVEEIEGHKIDHPEDGSKDLADVIARLIEHVSGQDQKRMSFATVTARGAQRPGTPVHTSGERKVDPTRTPSPADRHAAREAEERRAVAAPMGELDPGTDAPHRDVTVSPSGRMSFGSTGGTAARPRGTVGAPRTSRPL